MTKLFELTQAYQAILDSDELTPEEIVTCLNNVQDIVSGKALNIARLVITLQEEFDAIDNEIKRLSARKMTRVNKTASLKSYLAQAMEFCQITKVKDNFVSVTLQSNPPAVAIVDMTQIPEVYWRIIPEQREVDRQAILKTYKESGEKVAGTDIVTDKKHVVIR